MEDLNRFDDNLLSYLEKYGPVDKSKKCINYFGKWWTFEEVYENSKKVAKQLIARGFKKGDRITVALVGFPQAIFLILAASYLGLEMFMWDVRNNPESYRKIARRVKPKAIFVWDWDLKHVFKVCRSYKNIEFYSISPIECFSKKGTDFRYFSIALRSGRALPKPKNVFKWRVIENTDITGIELPEPAKSTPMYFPTSGSTGQSKYVILSSSNFCHQLYVYDLYFKRGKFHPFEENDSFMNFLPVFAATGLLMILTSMSFGVKQYIYPIPDIEKVWEQIIKNKCSYVFGPTKFYEGVTKFDFIKNEKDLSFIRFLGVGGDKLPSEKEEEYNAFFRERGSDVLMSNGYGMTEMTAPVAIQNGYDYIPGNCGFPLEDVTIKIVDSETGKEVKEGETGEIYMKSPSMMKGYIKYDENDEEYIVEPDEFIKTGDLGYIKDGQVFIQGRISRMVTMKNGCKFYSEEYERIISSLPWINEAAVICDNEAGVESDIMLFLNFDSNRNAKVLVQKTLKYIRKNMNPFEYPNHVYIVNKFPMLSSSKKNYKELQENARSGKYKQLIKEK